MLETKIEMCLPSLTQSVGGVEGRGGQGEDEGSEERELL